MLSGAPSQLVPEVPFCTRSSKSEMTSSGEQHMTFPPLSQSPGEKPTDPLFKFATDPKPSSLVQFIIFFKDLIYSTPHPWGQIFFVVAWSAIVAILNDGDVLDAGIVLDSGVTSTIKTILAFLIVFRSNQSVARWYEGRVLWGKLTFACIELTQQAASWIEDPILARRIMEQAVAFSYAVKQHLRQELLEKTPLEGLIHPAEVDRMNNLKIHVPYYCTDAIRMCIKKGLTTHPSAYGQQAIARGIDVNVMLMSRCFADMARISKTPQPVAYRSLLHFFTVLYLMLLPVLSSDLIGYWIIPEAFFTAYLMLGLLIAADFLEDPFGYDPNDLRVDEFFQSLRKQCLVTFTLGKKAGYHLTLPDGGAEAMLSAQGTSDSPTVLPRPSSVSAAGAGVIAPGS